MQVTPDLFQASDPKPGGEIILRDYQAEDVLAILEELKKSRATLYVAATGLGKTVVMSELVLRTLPLRVLLLAHRTELMTQARDSFQRRGIGADLEKAELVASTHELTREPVVIASVQTMLSGGDDCKRMKRFNPLDFGLLLYDESHHSIAEGNKSIVDYFLNGNPDLKCVGVTATPDRADEQALGQIFQSVAAKRDILFGIENGWLVEIEQMFVPVGGLDFSHVRTTAGDLNGGELAKVMEAESNIQGIVHPTLEALFTLPLHALDKIPPPEWGTFLSASTGNRRKAIVFTASVKQAEMLSNIFNRVIPGLSDWVCGKTSDEDRLKTFKKFKSGQTSVLVNVGVTTEGFDDPNVDLIVMARPTKSRALYAQMAGRGTRTLTGLVDSIGTKSERIKAIANSSKPSCLIMDFVGNSGRHKLMSLTDILGGKFGDEAKERALKRAKETNEPVRIMELMADEEEKIKQEKEQRRLAEEARKAKLVARVDYSTTAVNPFDRFQVRYQPPSRWERENGHFLSEKQRGILQRNGVNPDDISVSCGRKMIAAIFNQPATEGQKKVLIKHGYPVDCTKREASAIIDSLAKNGWRRNEATDGAATTIPVTQESSRQLFQKMREAISHG